jgi:hypothetical protein
LGAVTNTWLPWILNPKFLEVEFGNDMSPEHGLEHLHLSPPSPTCGALPPGWVNISVWVAVASSRLSARVIKGTAATKLVVNILVGEFWVCLF